LKNLSPDAFGFQSNSASALKEIGGLGVFRQEFKPTGCLRLKEPLIKNAEGSPSNGYIIRTSTTNQ
jgi:hypothetical protein